MRRDGFICYDCGKEYKHRGPAAVERIEGDWRELCTDCYDEWYEENVEGVEA